MKKLVSTKLGRLAVAGVVALVAFVGITVAANGAVKPDCKNLMYPLCPRSVAATQVVDNSLPKSKIVPADRDAFLKDTNTPDVKGEVLVSEDFEAKAVTLCGGSFKTRKTKLGEFTLPAGSKNVKIDSYLFAARTTTGPDTTVAQLALRVGASDTVFGTDYGTVFSNLPAHAGREITGSTFFTTPKDVVLPATVVEVFAFCYNDDDAGSDAGSNQWAASARVAVTQG